MFDHKCFCRLCGLEAIYQSRNKVLSTKQKKDLSFTCNDCMWEIWQKREKLEKFNQLTFF